MAFGVWPPLASTQIMQQHFRHLCARLSDSLPKPHAAEVNFIRLRYEVLSNVNPSVRVRVSSAGNIRRVLLLTAISCRKYPGLPWKPPTSPHFMSILNKTNVLFDDPRLIVHFLYFDPSFPSSKESSKATIWRSRWNFAISCWTAVRRGFSAT